MGIFGKKRRFKGEPTCEEVITFLVDYMEGRLEPEVARLFRSHIESCPFNCPNCMNFLEQYRLTIELTRSMPQEKPPDELVDATLAFLDEKLGRKEE